MSTYIHPQAICESTTIGSGTRIWAFAHLLPGARVGEECNICDHVFIENDVVVGDRVTIKCGVQLWDGVRIEDDVFLGPNATFTNDRIPRSKVYQERALQTRIACGASIGANATILPGITVGRRSVIGAGCVVTKNVPPGAIVVGNPGRISGYVDAGRHSVAEEVRITGTISEELPKEIAFASGVILFTLKSAADLRGKLSAGETDEGLPFVPKRYFVVYDVQSKHVRGEHAHFKCQQFLVCVKGSLAIVADNGLARDEILLDRPDKGLHVPSMIWCTQYKYSSDAVLLVLASEKYSADDYIRDYDMFLNLAATAANGTREFP